MAHDQEHTAPRNEKNEKNEIKQNAQQKDEAGRQAAREYDRDVKKMSQSEVDRAAKEAERALDGSEGEELRKAEQIGKRHGQGDDPGGKR
jgi:hypothetical protein